MEETNLTDTALTFKMIYFISRFVFLLVHICHNFLSRCYPSIESLTFCCSDRDYTEVLLFWKKIKLYCVSWVQTAGLFLSLACWGSSPYVAQLHWPRVLVHLPFSEHIPEILPVLYNTLLLIHTVLGTKAIDLCPLQVAYSR